MLVAQRMKSEWQHVCDKRWYVWEVVRCEST